MQQRACAGLAAPSTQRRLPPGHSLLRSPDACTSSGRCGRGCARPRQRGSDPLSPRGYSRRVGVIDLRSDTVTKPTPEMRHAMVNSPLGDDVFGDDPMVKKLEEMSMERMGKEAAVFVASGTMGNVLGVAVNAQHGQELIADADSHVYIYEGAGSAAISGVQVHPVATTRGVMSPQQIRAA